MGKGPANGVNAMWDIIQLVAHEFHSLVAGNGVPVEVSGRYAWQNETPAKVGFAADASSVELRQAVRRKRQLQHLRALQGNASVVAGQARADITRALIKQGGEPFCASLRAARSVGDFEGLVEKARKEEDRVLEAHRVRRKQHWYSWTKEGWEKDKRAVYKWIKEGPQPLRGVAPTVGPEGELRIGKQGQVERVEEEWWKLWQGPEPNVAAIEHLCRPFQGRSGNPGGKPR